MQENVALRGIKVGFCFVFLFSVALSCPVSRGKYPKLQSNAQGEA